MCTSTNGCMTQFLRKNRKNRDRFYIILLVQFIELTRLTFPVGISKRRQLCSLLKRYAAKSMWHSDPPGLKSKKYLTGILVIGVF
jgi:hypothetical protein